MKIYLDNTAWVRGPLSSVGLCAFYLSKALRQLHLARSDWQVLDVSRVPVKSGSQRSPEVKQMDFAKRLLGEKGSVYHSVDTMLPPFAKGRKVVTLHDCWTLRENDWQDPKFQKRKKLKLEKSLDRADAIVVPTQHVLDQMLKSKPNLASKLRKVGWGPMLALEHKEVDAREFIDKDAPVAKYLAKERSYVLCVANLENRKNHKLLFEAMKSLPNMDLVLVGGKGFGWEKVSKDFAELSKEQPCFHFEGLSQNAMKALYRNCLGLVQPSFDEGFGLPVCEALFFNKPLILSQIDPFYEIAGESAVYFDPHSGLNDLKSYLQALSQDPDFAESLSMKCETRKHLFSWELIARSYLQIYREL